MLTGLLRASLALDILCHVAALDLTQSYWITLGDRDVDPGTIHDFRLDLSSPAGYTALSSQIIIACDDRCDVSVNGEYIGSQTNWKTSNSFCVQLSPSSNVFAVRVQNGGIPIPNASAFIAVIQINYDDSSFQTFVTDTTWHANVFTVGFQDVYFDDSSWPYATIVGAANDPPWNLPAAPESPSSVSLVDAAWIWTTEVLPEQPNPNTPIGSRAFRKTFIMNGSSRAASGAIAIAADDTYMLYIQGNLVGSTPSGSRTAQRWKFNVEPADTQVVIAVEAANAGAYAGLIVAVAFETSLEFCSAATVFGFTDTTWLWQYRNDVPHGFTDPDYDDSSWPLVVVEAAYGNLPWWWIPITDAN